jgi:hypothetical protein
VTARKGATGGFSVGSGGQRAERINRGINAARDANAERVLCPHCELRITPHNLQRHIALVHEED